MNYLINITLTPKNGEPLDLGDTPCKWAAKGLDFLDAPYAFYEFIDEALGYDEATYTARTKFLDCFFDELNYLISVKGFDDGLEFTLNMPHKFFGVAFQISIFTE
jgi:hypothetical protein